MIKYKKVYSTSTTKPKVIVEKVTTKKMKAFISDLKSEYNNLISLDTRIRLNQSNITPLGGKNDSILSVWQLRSGHELAPLFIIGFVNEYPNISCATTLFFN